MAENYYLNHTATQIDAILTKVDGIAAGANVNVQVDWNQTTTTADDYIKNKPTIPDSQIQSDWEQTNTESKDFIKNKPTIPAAQVNADWEASSGVAQILNKPTIPDAQIQSDWNQTNTESKDFIKNKPTIPDAQVNSDWDSNSGVSQILHKPTLGTAAAKDYTTSVSGLSDDLITSSAVNNALSTKANLVDGKVPASELPSYVDDTVEGYYYDGAFYEDSEHTTAITGERGKIYVDLTTNKSYRWTGAIYTRVDECPAFGETQGTIYEGNKGKANADAITAIKDGTIIDSFADVETALGGKQATLTTAQQAAADSGITATKVAQYDSDSNVVANLAAGIVLVAHQASTSSASIVSLSYTANANDFVESDNYQARYTGTYLVHCVNWGTTGQPYIGLLTYSSHDPTKLTKTDIVTGFTPTITLTDGQIDISGCARISIYAMR